MPGGDLTYAVDADPQACGEETTIQLRRGEPTGGSDARNGTACNSPEGTDQPWEALTCRGGAGRGKGWGGGGREREVGLRLRTCLLDGVFYGCPCAGGDGH